MRLERGGGCKLEVFADLVPGKLPATSAVTAARDSFTLRRCVYSPASAYVATSNSCHLTLSVRPKTSCLSKAAALPGWIGARLSTFGQRAPSCPSLRGRRATLRGPAVSTTVAALVAAAVSCRVWRPTSQVNSSGQGAATFPRQANPQRATVR